MRAFWCDQCGNLVFFENYQCLKCNSRLGFAPDALDLVTLEPAEAEPQWRVVAGAKEGTLYRRCANDTQHAACNWLVPANEPDELCVSCRHNEIIPDLTAPGNLEMWTKVESAKRRLIYNLIQLNLFGERSNGLRFHFLGGNQTMTGHAEGLITLNMAEADDAEREKLRVNLHEPYRTLLGHFRHEVGHFYWDKLIANTGKLDAFRGLFGDERADYGQALQTHYANGPRPDWQLAFISAYASSHPWEDWAETWAHYLHMIDTIETAGSFGVSLAPRHPSAKLMRAEPSGTVVATSETPFERIVRNWIPLTYALNSLNRGMGLGDLYPFILSDAILAKLRFVHDVITDVLKSEAPVPPPPPPPAALASSQSNSSNAPQPAMAAKN